jgi:uncharacterized protein
MKYQTLTIVMKLLPQEIEVWYLIPAIRKELAVSLHNKGLKQKEISELIQVTPSAISQYLKEKGGSQTLKEEFKIRIDESAKELIEGKPLISIMKILSEEAWKMGVLCDLHKKYDNNLPEKCKLC